MRHPTLSGSKCTCVQCWLLSLLTCHLRRSVASQVTFSATDTFPPLTKVLSFISHKGICPYESSELGELWLGKLSIVIGPILKLISGVGWRKSKPVCCHCLSLRFVFLRQAGPLCVAGLAWNSNQSCLGPQVLSFTGMSYHTLSFVTSCFLSQDKFPKGRNHLSFLMEWLLMKCWRAHFLQHPELSVDTWRW